MSNLDDYRNKVPTDSTTPDTTMEMAKLGVEAESFLASPLGQFMVGRAELEIEKLTHELIFALPTDIDKNTQIRNKIQVAMNFKIWLVEAITSGHIALEQLQEREALDTD